MQLTVLGAAASWARGTDAASSCYLVENGDDALLLDLGQGGFARLAARRPPESVAAVFISHLHPDHCVDLIPLRHYLKYGVAAPPGTVALHAPAELPARFDSFLGESGFLADFVFRANEQGTLRVGSIEVAVARVTHTDSSFAFRVATGDGRRRAGVVYSGDCGDPAQLVALMRPGDTLLVEATFGAEQIPEGLAHLDALGAAAAARDGRAARLVLTHILPEPDAQAALAMARRLFGQETLLAYPDLVIEP